MNREHESMEGRGEVAVGWTILVATLVTGIIIGYWIASRT